MSCCDDVACPVRHRHGITFRCHPDESVRRARKPARRLPGRNPGYRGLGRGRTDPRLSRASA
jgi:hypothetical protein